MTMAINDERPSMQQKVLTDTAGGQRTILLTRHAGALQWLKQQLGPCARIEALEHLENITLRLGDRVYGIFPMNLAAMLCAAGVECWTIDFRMPSDLRGHELTSEQLDQLDAKLVRYLVQRVS